MAQANVPFRLLSRRNLDKGDVESVYGALVQAIGGSYFSGGVAQGPVNGALDWRNLSQDAGITNQFKSNASGLMSIELQEMGSGVVNTWIVTSFTLFAALPIHDLTPGPFAITEWNVGWTVASGNTLIPTVTFALSIRRGTSTIAVNTISSFLLTGTASDMAIGNATGLSVPLLPGDTLQVVVNCTVAQGSRSYLRAGVIVKAPHQR